MSSLAELPELVGFYSREDDEAFKGMLSALRDGIQRELSARTFRLWQDRAAIAPGKLWNRKSRRRSINHSFSFPSSLRGPLAANIANLNFNRFSPAKKRSVEAILFFQFFIFRLQRSRTKPDGAMTLYSQPSDDVNMSIGAPASSRC